MTCLVNAVIPASQFMIAPSLQQDFIDKDTGELLAFGIVTFYRDADHLTKKPVYAVSGPPDDPIFTELPNPLILSAIGTFIDPNNDQDIIPYYRPYDDEGNVDLYYITVYSADDQGNPAVLQFTRDHYPTVNISSNNTQVFAENFLPNGQFLLHITQSNPLVNTTSIFPVAYGYWQFAQTLNTTSVNAVTFPRFNSPSDNPLQDPRYACQIACTLADPADDRKDLYNTITNVNFMQGQDLTFSITTYSNDGNNHNVNFIIEQNFGVGGSPSVQTVIETLLVTPEIQAFTINFTMPSTIGKTLSSLNGDTLNLILRGPISSTSTISYTNAILVEGTFAALTYRPLTPEQDTAFSLSAVFDIPFYNGTDIGKFVQLTQSNTSRSLPGFKYTDLSTILIFPGMHFAYVGSTAPNGFKIENGDSFAVQAGGDLTPYVDLFNVILPGSTTGTYEYGTGINGFTNATDITGLGPLPDNQLYIVWNRFDIAQPAPDAGTSGFTFVLTTTLTPNVNRQVYTQTVLPASSITAGHYYRLPVNTTGPQFVQMFWFTIDGIGTQPAPAFNSVVKIDLLSTDTALQVRDKIVRFANGLFQIPDLQGRSIRYWNNGSYHDPIQSDARQPSQNNTASVVSPGFISYITGNQGDNIGSFDLENLLPDPIGTFNTQDLYFNAIIKT